jgi:hypothetical protein
MLARTSEERMSPASTFPCYQQGRFKIRTVPKQIPVEELRECKALYTVSVGAVGKSLTEVIDGNKWATETFSASSILLGDGLFRITLQITDGLEEGAASVAAKTAGDRTLEELIRYSGSSADYIRSSSVMGRPDFFDTLKVIRDIRNRQRAFAASIHADAEVFVERQSRKNRLKIDRKEALTLARRYVEEEVAVYLVLAQQGWLVDVYLGRELPTLRKIIDGELSDISPLLQKRVSISLEAKRRQERTFR